jgi:hypothetical protein
MPWTKYFIFVKSPELIDLREILPLLNLGHYQPINEVSFQDSNNPKTLFTGFYNGNLLIVHPELPFDFFSNEPSYTETLFTATFPGSEIAVLIEDTRVGLYSYAIIHEGQKIRMKNGCEGEVYNDMGYMLPEEREILSRPIFEPDEIADMKADGMTEEEIFLVVEHEASCRVPNILAKRYLGEAASSIDTKKIILTMYK